MGSIRHRVARHRTKWVCVVYYEDGSRRRITLKAANRFQAHAEAGRVVDTLERAEPRRQLTVGEIVDAYFEQSEAIWVSVERHHWKSAASAFSRLRPEGIDERACREYAASAPTTKPGTIRKHLSILRAALRWAYKRGLVHKEPHIWLPPAPPPRDRRLSREEFQRLEIAAGNSNHLFLFLWLARYTAARAGALLGLRWAECDFERRVISLGGTGRQKRRARVPMHPNLAFALVIAKEAAETDHVIEWAGKPVKSIKNAFRRAVKEAGLGKEVTPHVLRHTAASWMAEAGIPMAEIAAVLGHSDPSITFRVYAKYSPDYLQKAVRALG